MNIGKRNLFKVFRAIFDKRHYIALWNMIIFCPDFLNVFKKYLFGLGEYPFKINLRTPLGLISLTVYHYYDLLTVNEIFFRIDYKCPEDIKVVVDIGSNIGISALYFLTRNKTARCYLFEPFPQNVEKLKLNLIDFKDRFVLQEAAVADRKGFFDFSTEETGRYGSLGNKKGKLIKVKCLNINDILEDILNKENKIDILKMDIEGTEFHVLKEIEEEFFKKIKTIYFESDEIFNFSSSPLKKYFDQVQYGNVYRWHNKNFQ